MYERFTDRARKVMQLANREAQRLNEEYIGTDHILLGLVAEGSGVAAYVLKNLEVDPDKIRQKAEKIVQSGPDIVMIRKLPQTPRAKQVIEYAMEEAYNLKHNYIGTEHLLLGILRQTEGFGAQVLIDLGLNLKEVRHEVLTLLGGPVTEPAEPPTAATEWREAVPLEYTDRARKVMLLAAEEAYNLGHTYLGPEHILLAILREGSGTGVAILHESGLAESSLRGDIKLALAVARSDSPHTAFQLTLLSEFVLTNAARFAGWLGAEKIDSDHLLLGVLMENGGIVTEVFRNLNIDRTDLWDEIHRRLIAEED